MTSEIDCLVTGGHAMNDMPICRANTIMGPTPDSKTMPGGDPSSFVEMFSDNLS